MEKGGQRVAGFVLISGGIPLGPLALDDERAALFHSHSNGVGVLSPRVAPDLQGDRARALAESERWAKEVYAPALARRDSLSETERAAIIAQLSRFTGLDARLVDRKSLVVDRQFFLDHLLRDRGQGTLGRFDTRQIGGPPATERAVEGRRRALINRYLRRELGFTTDLVRELEVRCRVAPPRERRRAVAVQTRRCDRACRRSQHRRAARRNSTVAPPRNGHRLIASRVCGDGHLRFAEQLRGQRLRAEPAAATDARRITFRCYEGGHMMYLRVVEARFKLQRDIARFYAGDR